MKPHKAEAVSSSHVHEKSSPALEEFMRIVDEEYTKQNSSQEREEVSAFTLTKLRKELLSINDLSENKVRRFMESLFKYVDMVLVYLSNEQDMSYKQQNTYVDNLGDAISGVFRTKELKNIFVVESMQIILDKFLYDQYCDVGKKLLLTMFNKIDVSADRQIREETARSLLSYLFTLIDSISNYGDYYIQIDILETIYRMFGLQIKSLPEDYFVKYSILPSNDVALSESLAKALKTHSSEQNFEVFTRNWLNKYNSGSVNIFSILCRSVSIGSQACEPTDEEKDRKGIWVDFNLKDGHVSFYSQDKDGDKRWCRLNIIVTTTRRAQIKRIKDKPLVTISILFIKPIVCHHEACERKWRAEEKHLRLIIAKDNDKLNHLISHILPKMFKEAFLHTSNRISEQTRNVYKPLGIKISRRKANPSVVSSVLTTSDVGNVSGSVSTRVSRPPSERAVSVVTISSDLGTETELVAGNVRSAPGDVESENDDLNRKTSTFRNRPTSSASVALSEFTRYSTSKPGSVEVSPTPSHFLDDEDLPQLVNFDYSQGHRIVQDNIVTSSLNIIDVEDPEPGMFAEFQSSEQSAFHASEVLPSSPIIRSSYFAKRTKPSKTTEIALSERVTLGPESDEDVFETAKDLEGDNSDVNVETDDRNLMNSQEIDEIIESVAAEKQRLLEANANRCEETPDDLMANAEVESLMNSDHSRILTVAKPAELENKAFKMPQVALKDTIDKEDKENEDPAKTSETNQKRIVIPDLASNLQVSQRSPNHKSSQEILLKSQERMPRSQTSADMFSSTSQLSVQVDESENFSLAVNVGLPVTQDTGKVAKKELLVVLDKVNVNPLVDSRSSEQRVEDDGMDTCELLAVLTNSQSQRGLQEEAKKRQDAVELSLESVANENVRCSRAIAKERLLKRIKLQTKTKKDQDEPYKVKIKQQDLEPNLGDLLLAYVHYEPTQPRSAKKSAETKIATCLKLEGSSSQVTVADRPVQRAQKPIIKHFISSSQPDEESQEMVKSKLSKFENNVGDKLPSTTSIHTVVAQIHHSKDSDIESDSNPNARGPVKTSRALSKEKIIEILKSHVKTTKGDVQSERYFQRKPNAIDIFAEKLELVRRQPQQEQIDDDLPRKRTTREDRKKMQEKAVKSYVEIKQWLYEELEAETRKELNSKETIAKAEKKEHIKRINAALAETVRQLDEEFDRESSSQINDVSGKNQRDLQEFLSEITDAEHVPEKEVSEPPTSFEDLPSQKAIKAQTAEPEQLPVPEKELSEPPTSFEDLPSQKAIKAQTAEPKDQLEQKVEISPIRAEQLTSEKPETDHEVKTKDQSEQDLDKISICPEDDDLAGQKPETPLSGDLIENPVKTVPDLHDSIDFDEEVESVFDKGALKKNDEHDPDKSKSYAEPKPKVKKVTKTKQPEEDIKKARKSRKLANTQAETTKSTSFAEFLLKDDDDDDFGSSKKAKKSKSTVSSKAKDKLLEKINAPDNSWGLDEIFSRVQKNKEKEITTPKADIPENGFEDVPKKSAPRKKVEVPKPDTRKYILSPVDQLIRSPSPIPISRDTTDFIDKAQSLQTKRKLDDMFNVVDEASEETKPSHLIDESLLSDFEDDTIKTKEKLKTFSQLFDETVSTKSKNESTKSTSGRKRRKLYRHGSISHLEGTIGPLGAETPPQSDLALNTVSNKRLIRRRVSIKSRKRTKADKKDDCINASKLTNIFNNALDDNPLKFKCPHCRKCIKITSSRPLSPWVGESRSPTPFNDDGQIDIVDSYATRHTIPEAPRPSSNINVLEHIRLLPGQSDISHIQDNNDNVFQEPTLNQNTENSSVHPFNLPRDGSLHRYIKRS